MQLQLKLNFPDADEPTSSRVGYCIDSVRLVCDFPRYNESIDLYLPIKAVATELPEYSDPIVTNIEGYAQLEIAFPPVTDKHSALKMGEQLGEFIEQFLSEVRAIPDSELSFHERLELLEEIQSELKRSLD
jgi:hypothetical protein